MSERDELLRRLEEAFAAAGPDESAAGISVGALRELFTEYNTLYEENAQLRLRIGHLVPTAGSVNEEAASVGNVTGTAPAWPREPMDKRLEWCAQMLLKQDVLLWDEHTKIVDRIKRWSRRRRNQARSRAVRSEGARG